MKPFVFMTVSVLIGLLLSGCSFDLFHDTSWLTACDIDPTIEGCSPDAGDDGGQDAADGEVEGS